MRFSNSDQHQDLNDNRDVFQNNVMKSSLSSSNLKNYGQGYMRIHNLKQSKSQSQILPARNRFIGGVNSSSKSPLRKSSNSQNKSVNNKRNQTPNIIITSEEQQNENNQLQSDQNLQKTLPIKKKVESQSQDNTMISTIDDNSKKPQILVEIQNDNMKGEIERLKSQVTQLQDENQFCQLFNQKLEQIFLEILEISIESDYRSSDVDKVIEKYEELKKEKGDQYSLLEFRENISQMKELAQLKTNTFQQNSLFSSQENQNVNNIPKISHHNSSPAENQFQGFSNSSGNDNQNSYAGSPSAIRGSQNKRSLMPQDKNNQNQENDYYFTEEELQQRQHLALLEEVSQSLSQQINKNNLQTLEKIIKQEQNQQQTLQSPQLQSISFTNLNDQQMLQQNSPLMQSSFVQLKEMLQSNGTQRNNQSPVLLQQKISFKEEIEPQLSKKNSQNSRQFLNVMDNLQLDNENQQDLKSQIMQQIQKIQSIESSKNLMNHNNTMTDNMSKQLQQDQKQVFRQSNSLNQQVLLSKKQSLQSPQVNFSINNGSIIDKQNQFSLEQEMQQNLQKQLSQQQQQQIFQQQEQASLINTSYNKSILDQLNQLQQQKLLEMQQIQKLILQSQLPINQSASQNQQIPQIFGQNNHNILNQLEQKQQINPQTQTNSQYQQKPIKLNQTIESDIRTFDPSLSMASSVTSGYQQNQQAFHKQHYQNLLQRQQEKQQQDNIFHNGKYSNQSQFYKVAQEKNENDINSNPADDTSSIKTFDPDSIPQVNSAFNKGNQFYFGSIGGNNNNSQNKKNMSLIQFNNQKILSSLKNNKISENMPFLNGIKEQLEEGFDKKSITFRDTPKSCGENVLLSESEGHKTYKETQYSALKNIKNQII